MTTHIIQKMLGRACSCAAIAGLMAIASLPAAAQSTKKYQLIFSDDFKGASYSRPDTAKWGVTTRYWGTTNRWISKSPKVAFVKKGILHLRAIRNTTEPNDTAPMLTGSVETSDKFSFQYGKVEIRMRTKNHKGNFPALWMMPQPPAPGWPYAGEIDIVETIDAENVAYHTAHSDYTYFKKKDVETHACNKKIDVEQWHTYGLIWTSTSLTWTIDGVVTGSYNKSTKASELKEGQWPFDRPFYIIMNQSVGRGDWADNPDMNFTYETLVDWVKVYKEVE